MRMKRLFIVSCGLICLLLTGNSAPAQTTPYTLAPTVQEVYDRLTSQPAVRKGLDFLRADHENTVAEQKQLCEIPSPEILKFRTYNQGGPGCQGSYWSGTAAWPPRFLFGSRSISD